MSQLVQRITYTQTKRNVEMKLQRDVQVAYPTGGVLNQLYLHWKRNHEHEPSALLSVIYDLQSSEIAQRQ